MFTHQAVALFEKEECSNTQMDEVEEPVQCWDKKATKVVKTISNLEEKFKSVKQENGQNKNA